MSIVDSIERCCFSRVLHGHRSLWHFSVPTFFSSNSTSVPILAPFCRKQKKALAVRSHHVRQTRRKKRPSCESVVFCENRIISQEMVSLGPKKDGSPNAEFFTAPESLQGFETVRQWLQKNFKKVGTVAGGSSDVQLPNAAVENEPSWFSSVRVLGWLLMRKSFVFCVQSAFYLGICADLVWRICSAKNRDSH